MRKYNFDLMGSIQRDKKTQSIFLTSFRTCFGILAMLLEQIKSNSLFTFSFCGSCGVFSKLLRRHRNAQSPNSSFADYRTGCRPSSANAKRKSEPKKKNAAWFHVGFLGRTKFNACAYGNSLALKQPSRARVSLSAFAINFSVIASAAKQSTHHVIARRTTSDEAIQRDCHALRARNDKTHPVIARRTTSDEAIQKNNEIATGLRPRNEVLYSHSEGETRRISCTQCDTPERDSSHTLRMTEGNEIATGSRPRNDVLYSHCERSEAIQKAIQRDCHALWARNDKNKKSRNDKNPRNTRAAFSLVEIVVSLIVISVLLAAFIPVITKKLSSRDVTIGAQGVASEEVEYIIPQSQDDCPSYSVYTPGRTDGEEGGYCVIKWNVGDSSVDGQSGRSDFKLPDTVLMNPSTKVYDSSGTEFIIHKLTAGSGSAGSCSTSVNYGVSLNEEPDSLCCWQGTTASSCNATDGASSPSTYDGCTRTVCTWTAAVALCENMEFEGTKKGDWHLPDYQQMTLWRTTPTSNSAIISELNSGSVGLQLCGSGDSMVKCSNLSDCKGAYAFGCGARYVWTRYTTNAHDAYRFYLSSTFADATSNGSSTASVRCLAEKVPKNINTTSYTQEPLTKRLQTSETISRKELEITDKIKSAKIADIYSAGGQGGSGNVNITQVKSAPTSQADCPKAADGSDYTVYINGTCVAKWNMGDSRQSGNSDFALPDTVKINSSTGAYDSSADGKTVYLLKAGTDSGSGYNLTNGVDSFGGHLVCWGKGGQTVYGSYYTENDSNGSKYSGQYRTVCSWHTAIALCSNWTPHGTSIGDWHVPYETQMKAWRATPSENSAIVSGCYLPATSTSLQSCNKGPDGLQLCDDTSGFSAVWCYGSGSACDGANRDYCKPHAVWGTYSATSNYNNAFMLSSGVFSYGSDYTSSALSVRCLAEKVLKNQTTVYCGGGGASGMHQSDIEIPSDILSSAIGGKLVIDRASDGYASVVVYNSSDEILWGYRLKAGKKGNDATTSAVGAANTIDTSSCASYNTSTNAWVLSTCDSSAYTNSKAGSAGQTVTLSSDEEKLAGTASGGAFGSFTGGTLGGTSTVNGNAGSAYSAGGGGGCANYAGTKGSGGAGGIGYINLEYVTLE